MKFYLSIYLIIGISIFTITSCKKDSNPVSPSIVGMWKFTSEKDTIFSLTGDVLKDTSVINSSNMPDYFNFLSNGNVYVLYSFLIGRQYSLDLTGLPYWTFDYNTLNPPYLDSGQYVYSGNLDPRLILTSNQLTFVNRDTQNINGVTYITNSWKNYSK